jgi:hypothetical protein
MLYNKIMRNCFVFSQLHIFKMIFHVTDMSGWHRRQKVVGKATERLQ